MAVPCSYLTDFMLVIIPCYHFSMVYTKDYKGGYRLASKIKDEGFEADLYTKH
jgi:hypothetical protein